MGYLDGSTITVDAVLTKKGRQIISEGGALDVRYFTLSDTGVDYTTWNEDHASGSAYYGDAIENLPMVEALPNSQYSFRNKLVTLNRDTVSMPTLEVSPLTHTFSTNQPLDLTVNLIGYSAIPGMGLGSSGMHVVFPNDNIAHALNGQQIDITGNAMAFVYDQDIASARVYEVLQDGSTYNLTVQPATDLLQDTTMTLTFIDIQTGAYTQSTITVNADLVTQSQQASTGTQIG